MTPGSTIDDGRYLVLDVLGKGGMSTVYRVHDTRLGVDRALKVLSPRLASSSSLRASFSAEARIMARLQHPNVVSVQDIGEDDGQLYIVMELLEGGTLTQWVTLNGPMPERLAVEVLLPVMDALECAHEAGVFHRDVKPENIFLSRRGGAKIGDFGIAYVADLAVAESSAPVVAGTWAYMPPEQRNGAQAGGDAHSDVYALGSVLYFLMTARTPVDLFLVGDVPSLLEPVRGRTAEVILKATRHDPGLRYESVRALREALMELLLTLPPIPESTPPLVRPSFPNSITGPGVPVEAEFLTPVPDMFASPTLIAFDSLEDDTGEARQLVAMLATRSPTEPQVGLRTEGSQAPRAATASSSTRPLRTTPYALVVVLLVVLAWYAGLRWSAAHRARVEAEPSPAQVAPAAPPAAPLAAPPAAPSAAPSGAKASSPSPAPAPAHRAHPSAPAAPASDAASAADTLALEEAPASPMSSEIQTSDLKNPFGG